MTLPCCLSLTLFNSNAPIFNTDSILTHVDMADSITPASSSDGSSTAPAAAFRDGVSDQAIVDQVAAIRGEVESTQPLVGEQEPVESLLVTYAENSAFLPKIRNLATRYSGIRRIRGDGNCFYRAFAISIGEACVKAGVVPKGTAGDAPSALQRKYEQLVTYIDDSLDSLLALGYPEVTLPDFHEAMVSFVASWAAPGATAETVYAAFRDRMTGLYIITYLRCLCSLEMLAHEDDYFPYVLAVSNCATVRMFCECEVEPTHNDADQLQVIALARAWKVTVSIAYIDAAAGESASIMTFPQEDGAAATGGDALPHLVHLLYRPGHYDVAYPIAVAAST